MMGFGLVVAAEKFTEEREGHEWKELVHRCYWKAKRVEHGRVVTPLVCKRCLEVMPVCNFHFTSLVLSVLSTCLFETDEDVTV